MPSDSYHNDRTWESTFHPKIKAILGEHLLVAADNDEDMKHNTDLTTMRLESQRVGVRLRRANYLDQVDRNGVRYVDQFTIRKDRPNGCDTELAKIMAGWGDYFFYGFANLRGDDLACWMIGDLTQFRRWFYTTGSWESLAAAAKGNRDGSSGFYTFNIADLPKGFLVARKVYEPTRQLNLVEAS